MGKDEVMDFFHKAMGIDKTPYYCVRCTSVLEKIFVKLTPEGVRQLFFCKNKHCVKFGDITVVAKK